MSNSDTDKSASKSASNNDSGDGGIPLSTIMDDTPPGTPILVKALPGGRYQVVGGHRRCRALQDIARDAAGYSPE
jgi:hypothetical protein